MLMLVFSSSCVHVSMFGVCVGVLLCSMCWPFAHYMLCAALVYRCSFFVSVVGVLVMFVVGVLVCCGCLVCFLCVLCSLVCYLRFVC